MTRTSKQEQYLDDVFTYHPPVGDDMERYLALRASAKQFATCIMEYCPAGADQTAAIRLVREAVMTANAAVALKGRNPPV